MYTEMSEIHKQVRRRLGMSVREHLHLINLEFLANEAKKVAERARSYRGFRVGCALFAYNPHAYYYNDVHKVFRGVNIKLGPNSHKVCAEQAAINAAISEGYILIIAMAIAGIPQVDDHSGINSDTLHSCVNCREFFGKLPEIKPDTLIRTAHLRKGDIYEEFTIRDLLRLHNSSQ